MRMRTLGIAALVLALWFLLDIPLALLLGRLFGRHRHDPELADPFQLQRTRVLNGPRSRRRIGIRAAVVTCAVLAGGLTVTVGTAAAVGRLPADTPSPVVRLIKAVSPFKINTSAEARVDARRDAAKVAAAAKPTHTQRVATSSTRPSAAQRPTGHGHTKARTHATVKPKKSSSARIAAPLPPCVGTDATPTVPATTPAPATAAAPEASVGYGPPVAAGTLPRVPSDGAPPVPMAASDAAPTALSTPTATPTPSPTPTSTPTPTLTPTSSPESTPISATPAPSLPASVGARAGRSPGTTPSPTCSARTGVTPTNTEPTGTAAVPPPSDGGGAAPVDPAPASSSPVPGPPASVPAPSAADTSTATPGATYP